MVMRALTALAMVVTIFAGCSYAEEKSSVVQLRNGEGTSVCSGFVINAVQKLVLTADHCMSDGEPKTIDGGPAIEFNHDINLDYAVLFVPDLDPSRPALKPRVKPMELNQKVHMLGYVLEAYLDVSGNLIAKNVTFLDPEKSENNWGPYTMWFPNVIPGMSGGPVLDDEGNVTGMNQNASAKPAMSLSTPFPMILEKTKKYWP